MRLKMLVATLSLLCFSHSAFAVSMNAPVDFTPIEVQNEDGSTFDLSWHPVNDEQMAEANCKSTSAPSTETMEKYIAAQPASRQLNLLYEFNISADPKCSTALCTARTLWGKRIGTQIVYLKLKYGLNASENAFINSDRFTSDELDDVLQAVMDLPPKFKPFDTNKQLTHFSRGMTLTIYGNDPVSGNASISLFDIWSGGTHLTRQQDVFHELAHNMSTRLGGLDYSDEWVKVSGWKQSGVSLCQVSLYGDTNRVEDFAETAVMYRYRPEALKQICKSKYNYMRDKVFMGREYTSVAACNGISNQQVSQMVKAVVNHFDAANFDWNGFLQSAKTACKDLSDPACLNNQLTLEIAKSAALNNQVPVFLRKEVAAKALKELTTSKETSALISNTLKQFQAEADEQQRLKNEQTELAKFSSNVDVLKRYLNPELEAFYRNQRLTFDPKILYRKYLDTSTSDIVRFIEDSVVSSAFEKISASEPLFSKLDDRMKADFTQLAFTQADQNRSLLLEVIKSNRSYISYKLGFVATGATLKSLGMKPGELKRSLKVTPEVFCSTWYGGFDEFIPELKAWCIEEQSKVEKRFFFDESTAPMKTMLDKVRG